MLATVMGATSEALVLRSVPGFSNSTLLKLTLVLKGTLGPALYMSLPWMRSYIMPNPPRRTVLPIQSDHKQSRGGGRTPPSDCRQVLWEPQESFRGCQFHSDRTRCWLGLDLDLYPSRDWPPCIQLGAATRRRSD